MCIYIYIHTTLVTKKYKIIIIIIITISIIIIIIIVICCVAFVALFRLPILLARGMLGCVWLCCIFGVECYGIMSDTYAMLHLSSTDVDQCYVMLRHAMPCYAMPCHAIQCNALLCHAVPCYAMPCHAVPWYAMRYHALPCLLACGVIVAFAVSWSLSSVSGERKYDFANVAKRTWSNATLTTLNSALTPRQNNF